MSPSLEPLQPGESAYEMKFPLRPSVAKEVRDWARTNLPPDPHGAGEFGDAYEVTSLYLDTPQLDVFLGGGRVGRSKYRIRRYGQSDTVFLERKQKKEGVVRKWRTAIDAAELTRLAGVNQDPPWSGDWYRERLNSLDLHVVCQIRYERTARCAKSPLGSIRLTLDEKMAALPQKAIQFDSSVPIALADAPVILELKYRQEMPAIFKQLVRSFRLEPRAFSKYKLAVLDLGIGSAVISEPLLRSRSEQLACRIF
jgi:hypothetical protein